jgi:aryl-alcohol dehydrogenase-like predicted oxidoreductase
VDAALFLTDLKAAGKIKAVGLTNFDTKHVAEMVDAGAEIATNQIQYSLLDRRPEKIMVPYFRANGIGLLPYGVVAGGLLVGGGTGAGAGWSAGRCGAGVSHDRSEV